MRVIRRSVWRNRERSVTGRTPRRHARRAASRAASWAASHRGVCTFVVVALLATAPVLVPSASAQSRWIIEAVGSAAAPLDPQDFVDGWRPGLGIGGSLRARVGTVELGLDADFIQFGFEGLRHLSSLGGERRMLRLAVPLRTPLWRSQNEANQRLDLQVSGGWGHQSIAASFGGTFASTPTTHDGFVGTLGMRYTHPLYRHTVWSVGVRYTRFYFDAESPSHISILLGLQMPIDGSRPADP